MPQEPAKHLALEHDAVDAATAGQLVLFIVLFGVGHRAVKNRDAPGSGAFNGGFQVFDDTHQLERGLGHFKAGATFGKKVVTRSITRSAVLSAGKETVSCPFDK